MFRRICYPPELNIRIFNPKRAYRFVYWLLLLLFRRICYPPELNIRIFNPQYAAEQPPREMGVGAHPGPPQGRGG